MNEFKMFNCIMTYKPKGHLQIFSEKRNYIRENIIYNIKEIISYSCTQWNITLTLIDN